MFCRRCGKEVAADAAFCPSCGMKIGRSCHVSSGLGFFLPKNAAALWAYYLGIASLLPPIGILTCVPAFVMGVIGVRRAMLRPELKGGIHAWTGIVLGALALAFWLWLFSSP